MDARYDGHADWYDTTFHYYGDEDGSAGLLGRLLGPADSDDPVCVDIGCGTALHHEVLRARGYTVIGVDLSADQLRVAASRNPLVTDLDDFAAAVAEAARILRPSGRLVCVGPHPAYVGAFADRRSEVERHEVRMTAGYGDERLHRDPSGRFPLRSRIGVRYPTLSTFLGAFLAQEGLRLSSFTELDTGMRPWRSDTGDGRVLPWNIAVTAVASARR